MSRIIDRAMSRMVVDRSVRIGRVPDVRSAYGKYFARLVQSRIIELSNDHPIYPILSKKEWKTSFSISDHTLMWLWNFLNTNKPKSIVELGSGLSTLVFAIFAESCSGEKPRILSIDHDQNWLDQTRSRIQQLGLQDHIDFQLCKIGDLNLSGTDTKGYLVDSNMVQSSVGSPDMILIDGPPGKIGRFGTFPSVVKAIGGSADIFLDDALRPAEQEIAESWVRLFEGRLDLHAMYPLGKGFAHLKYVAN